MFFCSLIDFRKENISITGNILIGVFYLLFAVLYTALTFLFNSRLSVNNFLGSRMPSSINTNYFKMYFKKCDYVGDDADGDRKSREAFIIFVFGFCPDPYTRSSLLSFFFCLSLFLFLIPLLYLANSSPKR